MSLTPAASDPNQVNELIRRAKDPKSFGIGGLTDEQKKDVEARAAAIKQQQSGKK